MAPTPTILTVFLRLGLIQYRSEKPDQAIKTLKQGLTAAKKRAKTDRGCAAMAARFLACQVQILLQGASPNTKEALKALKEINAIVGAKPTGAARLEALFFKILGAHVQLTAHDFNACLKLLRVCSEELVDIDGELAEQSGDAGAGAGGAGATSSVMDAIHVTELREYLCVVKALFILRQGPVDSAIGTTHNLATVMDEFAECKFVGRDSPFLSWQSDTCFVGVVCLLRAASHHPNPNLDAGITQISSRLDVLSKGAAPAYLTTSTHSLSLNNPIEGSALGEEATLRNILMQLRFANCSNHLVKTNYPAALHALTALRDCIDESEERSTTAQCPLTHLHVRKAEFHLLAAVYLSVTGSSRPAWEAHLEAAEKLHPTPMTRTFHALFVLWTHIGIDAAKTAGASDLIANLIQTNKGTTLDYTLRAMCSYACGALRARFLCSDAEQLKTTKSELQSALHGANVTDNKQFCGLALAALGRLYVARMHKRDEAEKFILSGLQSIQTPGGKDIHGHAQCLEALEEFIRSDDASDKSQIEKLIDNKTRQQRKISSQIEGARGSPLHDQLLTMPFY